MDWEYRISHKCIGSQGRNHNLNERTERKPLPTLLDRYNHVYQVTSIFLDYAAEHSHHKQSIPEVNMLTGVKLKVI